MMHTHEDGSIAPAGCGCAAGNGPLANEGGAQFAWRTRGRLQPPAGQAYVGVKASVSQPYAPFQVQPVRTPATQGYATRCEKMRADVVAAGCGPMPAAGCGPAPAGQIYFGGFGAFPWSPYPDELMSDCIRWRSLTLNQKYQLAAQTVPPERVAIVVADLDRACGQSYGYAIYPFVQTYIWAFPSYHRVWGWHHSGHHHLAGTPIAPAG
jgi:hypothetical protein